MTGQLWDRPQFPGHFFLRKWSRQNWTPFGETLAQLDGHSESLPLPAPMAPLALPLGELLALFHWGWDGDQLGVRPLDLAGLEGELG